MKRFPHARDYLLLVGKVAIVLLAFTLFGLFDGAIAKGIGVAEDVAYRVDPSAERADRYAERHLDARKPLLYDIDRSEYYYRELEKTDPSYTYLYHQLARIEFLKGNFDLALFYINLQIERHGNETPNSYYMRGLIEGYKGEYSAAITDYATYLKRDPTNWAAQNDYAWVLLKAGQHEEALGAAEKGLAHFPNNPWVLNSKAIALYELGRYDEALVAAHAAASFVGGITEREWHTYYPGNDPRIAKVGIKTLQDSIEENIHRIEEAKDTNKIQ